MQSKILKALQKGELSTKKIKEAVIPMLGVKDIEDEALLAELEALAEHNLIKRVKKNIWSK
jgi:DNA-binding HxlR family transcriptional regulator